MYTYNIGHISESQSSCVSLKRNFTLLFCIALCPFFHTYIHDDEHDFLVFTNLKKSANYKSTRFWSIFFSWTYALPSSYHFVYINMSFYQYGSSCRKWDSLFHFSPFLCLSHLSVCVSICDRQILSLKAYSHAKI